MLSKMVFIQFLLYSFNIQAVIDNSSNINPNLVNQIQKDFKDALAGNVAPKVGDMVSWAGGTLTRTANNKLHYVNNNNNGYYEVDLDENSNLTKLARDNGDINNAWISQYGIDLANASGNTNVTDGYKIQVDHVAQYGLSPSYTKNNPWSFGHGLGAYNENGKVVFFDRTGPKTLDQLKQTNEYKALAGSNLVNDNKAIVNNNTSNSNLNYLAVEKDSSVNMLIAASVKYKDGSLSKDKFIEIALQVAATAKYNNLNNVGDKSSTTSNDPNLWFETNKDVLPKMRKEFQSYIDSSKPGEIKDWAGGKLIRKVGGALFVGPDGDAYFLRENSPSGAIDFNDAALNNSNIANEWKKQYGFTPEGKTRYQSERGFSSDSFTSKISGDIDSTSKEFGLKLKSWLKDNYNSLSPGGIKTWNGMKVIRAGNPYCLQIMTNDGSKQTQLCWSDDLKSNLPNDPFGSEVAHQYFGYNP